MKKKLVLVDIDDTLAVVSDTRRKFSENEDWDKVGDSDVTVDEPINQVMAMVKILMDSGYKIIFLTGRSDTLRPGTMIWLNKHFGEFGNDLSGTRLFMRKSGDIRSNLDVKKSLLDEYNIDLDDVLMAFEDDLDIINRLYVPNKVPVVLVNNTIPYMSVDTLKPLMRASKKGEK